MIAAVDVTVAFRVTLADGNSYSSVVLSIDGVVIVGLVLAAVLSRATMVGAVLFTPVLEAVADAEITTVETGISALLVEGVLQLGEDVIRASVEQDDSKTVTVADAVGDGLAATPDGVGVSDFPFTPPRDLAGFIEDETDAVARDLVGCTDDETDADVLKV